MKTLKFTILLIGLLNITCGVIASEAMIFDNTISMDAFRVPALFLAIIISLGIWTVVGTFLFLKDEQSQKKEAGR